MKLLLCLKCDDVFSLRTERVRKCLCKASSGGYEADGLSAFYKGPALMLGFANSTFTHAVREQLVKCDEGLQKMGGFGAYANELKGRDFTAFVIPESASSIQREGDVPTLEGMLELRKSARVRTKVK